MGLLDDLGLYARNRASTGPCWVLRLCCMGSSLNLGSFYRVQKIRVPYILFGIETGALLQRATHMLQRAGRDSVKLFDPGFLKKMYDMSIWICIYACKCMCIYIYVYTRTDSQAASQAGRRRDEDRQTDRQTDRQAHRLMHRHVRVFSCVQGWHRYLPNNDDNRSVGLRRFYDRWLAQVTQPGPS